MPSVPLSQPPGATAKTLGTGCPGWPFPTLPCTEQFPALPGTPAPPRAPSPQQPTVKAPIEELNEALAQIDCASLRSQISAQGSASISGTVPDAARPSKTTSASVCSGLGITRMVRVFRGTASDIVSGLVARPHQRGASGIVPLVGRGRRISRGNRWQTSSSLGGSSRLSGRRRLGCLLAGGHKNGGHSRDPAFRSVQCAGRRHRRPMRKR